MPNTINGTTTIEDVVAREILDSRGSPTIEVEVLLMGGERGVAAVPSGASTGVHEAGGVRGGDKRRYGGKGGVKAGHKVDDNIRDANNGPDSTQQSILDGMLVGLDCTPN